MPLISIRETSRTDDDFAAMLSFDGQGEYPITIRNPFSEQEEARLEWYFEQYLQFPFVRQVEFQAVASSIPTYGEALFKQVFADSDAYAEYKTGVQAGVETLRFEIAGSPEFHQLHWEALRDPNLPQALSLQTPMVRKHLQPQPVRATVRPSPTINLLIVTARPHGQRDVGYRTISRPLVEGSRSGEAWLAAGTFGDNVYELPGLDPEAASTLADRILEKHGATQYRKEEDFQKLLKLLDGYPLPLEVVLANLARQTPTQVLAALQAGDVNLDTGDSQKKTESILRCIDYSHSNLLPEAQGLLMCLAPFTSVINTQFLPQYIEQLKQQPVLAHRPFERWEEVLKEATNWGLLSPHPDAQGVLRLQPIFPYFLRSRLQTVEQDEMRNAVETAFQQHYDGLGGALAQLLQSKEAKEKQLGQALVGLEYENLIIALNLTLGAEASILKPYHALSLYLDTTQDQRRGLELGETVLAGLQKYPADKLAGPIGAEIVVAVDGIAMRQLMLKRYSEAETSYQEALTILSRQEALDKETREKVKAHTYHQLGRVAQEQRQWDQAEQYYQQALQIQIDFNARYDQARTYHQLGVMAQEQRQWDQAEQYYQQALQIQIDFNARYEQASTYHQLGRMAQEQRQWEQALDYFLKDLEITLEFNDEAGLPITLRSLARLWQASSDTNLPTSLALILKITAEEAEKLLQDLLPKEE